MASIVSNMTSNTDDELSKPSSLSMGSSDSVEDRVSGIISKDSDLMKMARTGAEQSAQDKGLRHSSLAVQAGENAVIQNALPIASQDANTSASMKLAEYDADNAINQIRESGDQQRQTNQSSIDAGTDAESRLIQERADAEAGLQETNFQYEQIMQGMRGDQAKELENIQAENNRLIQTSQSASTFYSYMASSLSEIMANPDLTQESKQAQINQMNNLLRSGLSVIGGSMNIDLSGLLTFSGKALGGFVNSETGSTPSTSTPTQTTNPATSTPATPSTNSSDIKGDDTREDVAQALEKYRGISPDRNDYDSATAYREASRERQRLWRYISTNDPYARPTAA